MTIISPRTINEKIDLLIILKDKELTKEIISDKKQLEGI